MSKTYHYFLLKIKDNLYRAGIEGSRERAEEYFKTFHVNMIGKKYYAQVDYIDEYPLLFSGDIDEYWGEGNQKHDGFTIKTFKYIYQFRSQRKENNFFAYLKQLHKQIKSQQEYIVKQKEEQKRKREEKKRRDLVCS